MNVIEMRRDHQQPPSIDRDRRFDRVGLTCVFGNPRDRSSWSGAPNNLGAALERLGIRVESLSPSISQTDRLTLASRYLLSGYGRLRKTEQILRSAPARQRLARQVAAMAEQLDLRHVLHTGTLDLPALDLLRGTKHYIYCDQTWALSLRNRPDASHFSAKATEEFERLERESLLGVEHVFTFGNYVREDIVNHYGLPPARVTAVGSGMGKIDPHVGPKDYARPNLLFVAKHLFQAKGGPLLLEAFSIALRTRPDIKLTIVGDERSRGFVQPHPNVTFRAHLPWLELQGLFRGATLLTQPMLNDPWGQVYLEALVSRTPVLGLRRNGLPEITGNGQFGFLVSRAEPEAVAAAIIDAVSDPERLAEMGRAGQKHVLRHYSWDNVAQQIAFR